MRTKEALGHCQTFLTLAKNCETSIFLMLENVFRNSFKFKLSGGNRKQKGRIYLFVKWSRKQHHIAGHWWSIPYFNRLICSHIILVRLKQLFNGFVLPKAPHSYSSILSHQSLRALLGVHDSVSADKSALSTMHEELDDISCTALYLNSDNMTLLFLILKMLHKCSQHTWNEVHGKSRKTLKLKIERKNCVLLDRYWGYTFFFNNTLMIL